MNRLMTIDKLKLYRTLAVALLFIGLFVSSGEGVRLFPIPISNNHRSSTQEPGAKNSASERYNVGVRQVRSFSFSKYKNTKRPTPQLAALLPNGNENAVVALYLEQPREGSFGEGSRRMIADLLSPSDRAPPTT